MWLMNCILMNGLLGIMRIIGISILSKASSHMKRRLWLAFISRIMATSIDGQEIRQEWPEHLHFETGGATVWMTHIGGRPPKYAKGILPELTQRRPTLFVCGHSHILLVKKVERWGGLHLNPGAAGISGFHKVRTMLRFEIHEGTVSNMRVIEWPRR